MSSPIEIRIKKIQKILNVVQTVIFDLATCKDLEVSQSINFEVFRLISSNPWKNNN